MAEGDQTKLCIKWGGQEYAVELPAAETVGTLKRKLEEQTQVVAKRQKLLGLKTKDGKLATDETPIAVLAIKPNVKIMMMGTREDIIKETEQQAAAAPEVQDDFDVSPEDEALLDVKDRPEVMAKLQRRISSVQVKVLNPPRPGKKCLVIDIDYTIFSLDATAERAEELARPHLHHFLERCYEYYDIVIWSATNMKWVEVKMRELGVLGHPNYRLTCMLDHSAMVTVQTEKYGVFDCKPLAFLWAKFPEYHEGNTVMLDDLRRNFIMNKQQGLVIRPYKRAHINRHTDKELLHLTTYLTLIGRLDNLLELNHRRWERYLEKHARE